MRERIQNGPRKSKNTNYKYKKTHEKKGQVEEWCSLGVQSLQESVRANTLASSGLLFLSDPYPV